ncbi:hypothetical protein BOTBODRAFT_170934 [Botryobasidium botryosum FD-172 SS1]|uniref:Xylanolytic transcriptional activator regulatory domain-containing protein n=1 Tax=Botryobasidium botryosum (strain FD-172 SS1) TaxID=930990 RepID=A0A067MTN5_BOTB1|nr:hypothetical protein BOTBODRAFT_170934 [Botryobasidium botryosum FD-172 SS1]
MHHPPPARPLDHLHQWAVRPSADDAPDAAPSPAGSSASKLPVRGKRKRLAKACDSCHKSKRRCDGTGARLCAVFQLRLCRPPLRLHRCQRTRRPAPNPRADPRTPPHDARSLSPSWAANDLDDPDGILRGRARPKYADTRSALAWSPRNPINAHLGLDPVVVRDLVNLFFCHVHPHNMMIHRTTFLSDLSLGRVPSFLLNSIFALAAPFSSLPTIRQDPVWQSGERFAEAARSAMFDTQGNLMCPRKLECAQALIFLQLHECAVRRPAPSDMDKYMRLAFRVLTDLGVTALDKQQPGSSSSVGPGSGSGPPSVLGSGEGGEITPGLWISKECHRRTLWLVHFIELLSSAFTQRPMSFDEGELGVCLPVEEACFELVVMTGIEPEYLPYPDPLRQAASVSELGHLVRVTSVYAKIANMLAERERAIERARADGSAPHNPILMGASGVAGQMAEWEKELEMWEKSLPDRLRFNTENLAMHMANLANGANTCAWTFGYMHALAECCILALQEALMSFNDRERLLNHQGRHRQALHNLGQIVEGLGTVGRSNIMMATPFLALLKHQDVLAEDMRLRLGMWCKDYEQQWGVGLAQILSVEFRRDWCRYYTSPESRSPLVPTGALPPMETAEGPRMERPEMRMEGVSTDHGAGVGTGTSGIVGGDVGGGVGVISGAGPSVLTPAGSMVNGSGSGSGGGKRSRAASGGEVGPGASVRARTASGSVPRAPAPQALTPRAHPLSQLPPPLPVTPTSTTTAASTSTMATSATAQGDFSADSQMRRFRHSSGASTSSVGLGSAGAGASGGAGAGAGVGVSGSAYGSSSPQFHPPSSIPSPAMSHASSRTGGEDGVGGLLASPAQRGQHGQHGQTASFGRSYANGSVELQPQHHQQQQHHHHPPHQHPPQQQHTVQMQHGARRSPELAYGGTNISSRRRA